jgi:hypothetical protein
MFSKLSIRCFSRIPVCVERLSSVKSSLIQNSSSAVNLQSGQPPSDSINVDNTLIADKNEDDVDSYSETVSYAEDLPDVGAQPSLDLAESDCTQQANVSDHTGKTDKAGQGQPKESVASETSTNSSSVVSKSEAAPVSYVAKSEVLTIGSNSQPSVGKVGSGMPPVARKLISTSSALFQRKKQALSDHKKSASSGGTANVPVTLPAVSVAAASSESSSLSATITTSSVTQNISPKSAYSSPVVCCPSATDKSLSTSSAVITTSSVSSVCSLSSSVTNLSAAVDTISICSELSVGANDTNSENSLTEQGDGRKMSGFDLATSDTSSVNGAEKKPSVAKHTEV